MSFGTPSRRVPVWLLAACVVVFAAGASSPGLFGRAVTTEPAVTQDDAAGARPLRLLFLGHEQRNHNSHVMFPLLAPTMARRGIQLTHVDTPAEALRADILQYYDGLVIYGNHTEITPEQEQTLVDFVEGGKGLVALHSASFMFTDSERYIPMVGGQFQRHGTGEFSAEIVAPDHPALKGVYSFTTWDETYVHTRHNPENRTVLMERVDAEGREPYTWVRTQGQGRVFYTAFGHDERTWSNPGFHKLVESGIAWAVPEEARQKYARLRMPVPQYAGGHNVPNYEQRNPAPLYQMPFAPEDAERFIVLPAEYELQLFASEPDIIKPISFNFDERGRMWVIEAIDYPNTVRQPGEPGLDRIRILEDTDGDGKADKFTVFADQLNLPTSLVFANDGVIVSSTPNFLFLKDTDGDDVADVQQVFSSGWGTRDTHAMASSLMYGHDNYIWGTVGYSGYNGVMNGQPMQFGQGVYRFRPDGSGFDYIAGATNNTWGFGLSETFDIFGSTANNDPSFNIAIPNRYFEGVEGLPNGTASGRGVGPGYASIAAFYPVHPMTPYIRQVDVFGGFTAAAGHQIYTARSFPQSYWNRVALINEPTAHLTAQGILERDGSGFTTKDGWNLISSAEEWFAPVHAQVGPDGAIWIADWYNFIIQHNPTPTGYTNGPGNAYQSELRDHQRGRIYRISYRNAEASPAMSLSKDDPAGLVAALSSDNMFWRMHGQRLLVERGEMDVVPDLVALVGNRSVDEIGLNGAALHALWTLHGLGALDAPMGAAFDAAVEALEHPAAGVRKAAAMVLPKTAEGAAALLDANVLTDPNLTTRLAVVLTLADMPANVPGIGQALLAASRQADNYGDTWLGRALYVAGLRHADSFLAAQAAAGATPFEDLPVALRLPDNAQPDWRTPDAADVAANWQDMEVPGAWETRGLPGFDGAVWFTRTFSSNTTGAGTLTLGRMRNNGQVFLNGQELAAPAPPVDPNAPPAALVGGRGQGAGGRGGGRGRGRGNAAGIFEVQAGVLNVGENVLTVRIQNNRNDGGFLAEDENGLFLQVGSARTPLAGTWKYRIERQTNAAPLYAQPGDLAAHIALTRAGGPAMASAAVTGPLLTDEPAEPAVPLTAAEQQRFETGSEIYATVCVSCHQPDGRGAENIAASLIDSPIALGPAGAPVRVLLQGKQGNVGLMPPLGPSLSDDQIAAALTYVRREWGHTAGAVDPALVRDLRASTSSRATPWTDDELAAIDE